MEERITMAPVPAKPLISASDLEKLDIRVGTIRQVEDVPNSDKLVRLVVGFGDHERSILAGLKKERPNLDVLRGKQTLFVINLTPRKMAGLVSEGMLLDIGYADGLVPVLTIPEQPVPDGSRAGLEDKRPRLTTRSSGPEKLENGGTFPN
jgi:tRNA-binding protein